MKRLLFLLVMLLSLTTTAFATQVKIDSLWYNLMSDEKTAQVIQDINQNFNYYSGDIVIPETVKYEGTTYSVTSIGDRAFGSNRGLIPVRIPNSVKSIGDGAFQHCYDLTSVNIPDRVTSIGDLTFYACWSLTSITIPNGVTSIENDAFHACRSLTSVTIPYSVTSIGDSAFEDCSGLTSVISLNPIPPTIESSTFSGAYSATLLVPKGSKDAYATADWWSNFANMEEIGTITMSGDVNSDQAVDVADVVAIVNYILGEPDAGFVEAAADVNGDGKIDVDDVVQTVNIILGE